MPAKSLTKEAALLKMAALCARSEQCAYDIMSKLRTKGMSAADCEWVLEELKSRKFVDDARFARSFTNDKIRFASWGRNKIRMALIGKRIGERDIREAFDGIDGSEYEAAAERVAKSKAKSLDLGQREENIKLYRHLLSRGFESDIAMRMLKKTKVDGESPR